MANYNITILDSLEEQGDLVEKIDYLGYTRSIPFFIDNGTAGLNSGDTITFSKRLPNRTTAVKVHLKTAGVGASTTLTFKRGTTAISGAIATSTAIDAAYLFTEAGEQYCDASDEVLTATVGGADWDDGANDVWGVIELLQNQ